jgi:hypothetical protein
MEWRRGPFRTHSHARLAVPQKSSRKLSASRRRNARYVSAQELRFEVDRLHGLFVKVVDVCFLGHLDRILLLRRGYHVVSSQDRGAHSL